MLIAILVRKMVWQGSNKTDEQPYFHCVPSFRMKQEKKKRRCRKNNPYDSQNIIKSTNIS